MIVIGYHGCSKELGLNVVSRNAELVPNNKPYHWLGDGLYFWENDPYRALEWAHQKASRGELQEPFVIGAVIDLGRCFDLHVRENQILLRSAYKSLQAYSKVAGLKIRANAKAPKDDSKDKVLRFKDCAVINHLMNIDDKFDTVRGLFVEGEPVYSGARIFLRRILKSRLETQNVSRAFLFQTNRFWGSSL